MPVPVRVGEHGVEMQFAQHSCLKEITKPQGVGVGRPKYDAADHVLAPFDESERAALPAIVSAAADAVRIWLDEGIDAAMRFANTWQGVGA